MMAMQNNPLKNNNESLIPIDVGAISQFATGKLEQSPTIFVQYTLYDLIDENRLRESLIQALDIFTQFKVKLVYDSLENKVFYSKNELEPDIYHYDGKSNLFGKNSNDYLFRVYCDGKNISLSMHHMLTDAFGATNFLNVILSYYFGLDPYRELMLDPKDVEDPYVLYGDDSVQGFSMKNKWSNEIIIPNDMKFRRGETYLTNEISFSITDLLKRSKRAESSVFPLLSWLLSKSVVKAYECEDKTIVSSGAFNCRKLFDSKTPKCFSHSLNMILHPYELNMDIDKQLTIQRARMDLEIDKETVSNELAFRRKAAEQRMEELKEYINNQDAIDQKRKADSSRISFFNTYSGQINFSEQLKPYIKDFKWAIPATRNPITATSWSMNEHLRMNLEEASCYKSIAPYVIETAREYGIEANIVKSYDFCFDYYPMEELFDD